MKCKLSNKNIDPFMSFGKMPIANGFIEKKNFEKEFFFEMEVGFSEDLSLFQLNDHPQPIDMFNENYPFFSGSSKYMIEHFKNFSEYLKKINIKQNSRIIEIGSNDGTMLKNFNKNDFKVLGFEPSKNVADQATKNGIPTLNEFFNLENIKKIKDYHSSTDIIYASNVICHIPDLDDLIKSLDILLSKNGIFVFEEPYLGSMFEKTSYDQIYDEHIYMFSASAIQKIFNLYDFRLTNIEFQTTHGGSMRYTIERKHKNEKSINLINILEFEKKEKIDSIERCFKFKKECESSRIRIKSALEKFKYEKKSIAGYAATSKSTTILNYCDIDNKMIDFICDTTPEKIGKFTPGTHIPVVDMNYFNNNIPDIAYLFAWNHKNEIFKKEKNFSGEWFSHVSL